MNFTLNILPFKQKFRYISLFLHDYHFLHSVPCSGKGHGCQYPPALPVPGTGDPRPPGCTERSVIVHSGSGRSHCAQPAEHTPAVLPEHRPRPLVQSPPGVPVSTGCAIRRQPPPGCRSPFLVRPPVGATPGPPGCAPPVLQRPPPSPAGIGANRHASLAAPPPTGRGPLPRRRRRTAPGAYSHHFDSSAGRVSRRPGCPPRTRPLSAALLRVYSGKVKVGPVRRRARPAGLPQGRCRRARPAQGSGNAVPIRRGVALLGQLQHPASGLPP